MVCLTCDCAAQPSSAIKRSFRCSLYDRLVTMLFQPSHAVQSPVALYDMVDLRLCWPVKLSHMEVFRFRFSWYDGPAGPVTVLFHLPCYTDSIAFDGMVDV